MKVSFLEDFHEAALLIASKVSDGGAGREKGRNPMGKVNVDQRGPQQQKQRL